MSDFDDDFKNIIAQLPRTVTTLCGNVAEFDVGSGMGYRCTTCNAIIGSVGMPKECKQLYTTKEEKHKIWSILNK